MGEVSIVEKMNLPAELAEFFDPTGMEDDLSAGVSGGFSILSFRGSKWRVKHAGGEEMVTNDEGDPRASLEMVFLKASPDISKTYYEGGYTEGSDQPPTCVSTQGVTPDKDSTTPQAPSCAACPHNQWGSRITDDGRKGKACSDSRRIAVVPAFDMENETYGGPMLLRVPAASLNDLKSYGLGMKKKGFPYNAIVTRVSFDPEPSYPKLIFKPVRPITADEAGVLASHYQSDKIENILSGSATPAETPKPPAKEPMKKPEEGYSLEFEQQEQEEAPAEAAPKKKPARKPRAKKPAAKPAPEPAAAQAEVEEDDALGSEMDAIVAGLDGLE